jgi:DNA-binding transcriptional ArsR family regulator
MATDTLSRTFAALAAPTRRAILARLSKGEASAGELAKPFKMSQPAISRHLKVLEKSGLISRGRQAQWRPCRMEPEPILEALAWMEHQRKEFDASLNRLEQYLTELQKKPTR